MQNTVTTVPKTQEYSNLPSSDLGPAECSMYTVWCMYTLRQPKRYLFAANWSMCVVPMQLSMQVTATHAACCNAYANLWSVRNWQLFRDATVPKTQEYSNLPSSDLGPAECSMYTVWCMYTLRQPKRYLFAANWSMCVVPMQLSMQVTATHAACCNAYANLWSVRNWQLFRDATVPKTQEYSNLPSSDLGPTKDETIGCPIFRSRRDYLITSHTRHRSNQAW